MALAPQILVASGFVHVAATTGSPFALLGVETIAIGLFEGEPGELGPAAWLLEAGEARPEFKHLALAHIDGRRVIVAGLGARAEFDAERARVAAATVYRRATELGAETLCWALPDGGDDDVAAALVHGTLLRAYRFDRYRRTAEDSPHGPGAPGDQRRTRPLGDRPLGRAWSPSHRTARGTSGTCLPNELTPAALAAYALELAGRLRRACRWRSVTATGSDRREWERSRPSARARTRTSG